MTAALEGGELSAARWPHFTPGKDPVTILQEAGCAPGPVWTNRKSRPHWDSMPDRPSCSQSLYRLSYRTHINTICTSCKSQALLIWELFKLCTVYFNLFCNVNKIPTRCNSTQIFIHCKVTLHVSGVTAPIIRSTKNCNRNLRYRS